MNFVFLSHKLKAAPGYENYYSVDKWRKTFTVEETEKTNNKLCSAWTSYKFSDLGGQKNVLLSFFPVSNPPRQFLCILMQNKNSVRRKNKIKKERTKQAIPQPGHI